MGGSDSDVECLGRKELRDSNWNIGGLEVNCGPLRSGDMGKAVPLTTGDDGALACIGAMVPLAAVRLTCTEGSVKFRRRDVILRKEESERRGLRAAMIGSFGTVVGGCRPSSLSFERCEESRSVPSSITGSILGGTMTRIWLISTAVSDFLRFLGR